MSPTDSLKQERMHIRLDTISKLKIERAAAYQNKNISEFVINQAVSGADQVIKAHETVALTVEDAQVFMDALENPPKPNKKLLAAFADLKALRSV
jgi:uncharacterized protein (DUF1778 family)